MSTSANVQSIQALSEFRGALARFGGEAQNSLNAAQLEIRRTLEWLEERKRYWQRQVSHCQEYVDRAQSALAHCQNSRYYDHKTGRSYVPDCRSYQQALYQAERYLRQAESELRTVLQAITAVQQAITDYQRQAQRLATMLGNDLPKAAAVLGRSLAILESYVAMSAPSGGTLSTSSSLPSSTSQPSTATLSPEEATQDQMFQNAKGDNFTIRTYPSGNNYYLRVYDQSKTEEIPTLITTGNSGLANLQLEQDENGNVRRVKLQDIITTPSYQGAGVGSQMLSQVEAIARSHGASEIYGLAPEDKAIRAWYTKRGYAFRKDGREVYKVLS